MTVELAVEIERRDGLFYFSEETGFDFRQSFEVLVKRIQRHVAYAKAHLYLDRPREIEFAFLFQTSLNAFSYASRQSHAVPFDFIGVNAGVFFTLVDIFLRLLADRDTFPDIGNRDLEDQAADETLPYLTKDALKTGFHARMPNCPIRRLYATTLCQVVGPEQPTLKPHSEKMMSATAA